MAGYLKRIKKKKKKEEKKEPMGIFNFQLFILGNKYLFFILAANPIVFCYKKFSDKNLKGFSNWNFLVKLFELTSLLTSNLKISILTILINH